MSYKTGDEFIDQIKYALKDQSRYADLCKKSRAIADKYWLEDEKNLGKHYEAYFTPFGSPERKYLKECTLYVTLEPCQMCAGASYWAQIGKIVYGASEPERGFKKLKTTVHPKTTVVQGVLEHECSQLLKRFFVEKRNLN